MLKQLALAAFLAVAATSQALAAADVTVTSIRVGSDTVNLDLLDAISRATGGSFHHVADVRQLPQLMIRDAQRLMGRATERSAMTPRIAVTSISRPITTTAIHGTMPLPPLAARKMNAPQMMILAMW